MTWQAAILIGLAAVLIAGFAWYERSRPSARLVALVAALAALAVVGRLVLVPIPNLVATSDIALITGYALGAGPGFAVGALAAPISNIWLGQGPWTAWQMAGWGMVGLLGAWLALLTRRRAGRLVLAIACGLAGLAYGALLDLSVMVSYGGEQSLDRYLAISARSIPFNVVHAVGNFAIALAAGPALVRMISRYRTRLRFTWEPAAASVVIGALVIAVAGGGSPSAAAGPAAKSPTGKARAWLAGAQNPDGGFGATLDFPSSPAMTGWVMLGLEAAGRNPLDLRKSGETPVSYLRSEAGRLRSDGDLERTILALDGAGLNPRRFAGRDLVAELRDYRDGDGSVDGQVNRTAFYVLAMRSAGVDAASLSRSARWLRRAQGRDGGWGVQPGAPSDPDSTGAALQGLASAGSGGRTSAKGVRYLRRAQARGGGFTLASSTVVNAQSTAWAVQGMVAAGGGGASVRRAIDYLGRQRASDGHYRYSASSDQTPVWVTSQVLLAVEREALPLDPVSRRAERSGSESASEGGGASAGGSAATSGGGQSSSSGATTSGRGDGSGAASSSSGGGPSAGTGATSAPAQASNDAASPSSGGASDRGATSTSPGADTVGIATDEITVATTATTNTDDDSSSTPWAIAGATALVALLAGGLAWYRRSGAEPRRR